MTPGNRPRHRHGLNRPPVECPVCAQSLIISRLRCLGCGTELQGNFTACEFCALSEQDLELIKVFLASRGNLREVEKHLGVSYPTARARLTAVLAKMGLAGPDDPGTPTRDEILAEVASGALTPAEAAALLATPPAR